MTLHTETILDEEAFIERFLPRPNPINPLAPLDFGEGGCLYETFGEELEAIRQARPEHVWTLVDTDGSVMLVSGCHFVNRLGYVLCTEPVPLDLCFVVPFDEGGAA